MNIVVSAAALRIGGARTIYRQFINHLSERIDNNRYIIFVDHVMEQPIIENVKYIEVNTRGKIRRILFDCYDCKKLLKTINFHPDKIISLQNTGVRCLKNIHQIIYYHQSLPFYRRKWNPLRKDERAMFFYENFYPYFVKKSIGDKVDFVVQIPFIKKGVHDYFKVSNEKIHVLFPDFEITPTSNIIPYSYTEGFKHFVYVALYAPYKGHDTLAIALSKIKKRFPDLSKSIKIHLTMTEADSSQFYNFAKKLGVLNNFVFEGLLPHDKILSMYRGSNGLLFPSTIETLGLPLIEAASLGTKILVSDLPYAHEVLKTYEGASYIEPLNYEEWARQIINTCKKNEHFQPLKMEGKSSWEDFFNLVDKE